MSDEDITKNNDFLKNFTKSYIKHPLFREEYSAAMYNIIH